MIDEAGSHEVPNDRDASADADVLIPRGVAGGLQRLGGWDVDEVDVVPPSISIGGRGWWVSTNTGVWKGGSGPHQPFHSGSSCQPG